MEGIERAVLIFKPGVFYGDLFPAAHIFPDKKFPDLSPFPLGSRSRNPIKKSTDTGKIHLGHFSSVIF